MLRPMQRSEAPGDARGGGASRDDRGPTFSNQIPETIERFMPLYRDFFKSAYEWDVCGPLRACVREAGSPTLPGCPGGYTLLRK